MQNPTYNRRSLFSRHPVAKLIAPVFITVLLSQTEPTYGGAYNQTTVTQGIQVWRDVPDAKGRTCASCHGSPDAFDLAYFNFTEADIRRRDANHIDVSNSDKIVALVGELRKKYDILSPRNPRTTRLFQPGGAPLPGTTATERDAAFSQQLQTKLPTLATGDVNSATVAETAVTELLNYDLTKEKTGILLPMWSEDISFGTSHGRLTDWIADQGSVYKSATDKASLFALQDAYLADPTEANFWKMYQGVRNYTVIASPVTTLTDPALVKNNQDFFRTKFLNSLIGSHDIRMLQMGRPTILGKSGKHSQFYKNSSGANQYVQVTFELGDPRGMGTFTDEVRATLESGISPNDHVIAGRDAWWWLGFMYNPATQSESERQEYFPNSLRSNQTEARRDQGSGFFASHSQFYRIRSDVALFRVQDPGTTTPPAYWSQRGSALSPFLPNPRILAQYPISPDGAGRFWNATHQAQFKKISLNTTKMRLYMIKKQIEAERAAGKTYRVIHGDNETESTTDFRCCYQQLNTYDSANASHNNSLFNTVRSLQRDWKNGSTVPVEGTGTGLKAEIFDNLDFTGLLTTRVDPAVDYFNGAPEYGGTNGLISTAAGTDVSVRWTGYYSPRYTDTYSFRAMIPTAASITTTVPVSDGFVRVWVNNTLVLDRWTSTGSINSGVTPISLSAGVKYPIRVEYKQPGAFQMICLWHSSSKELMGTIPSSLLYPN